MQANEPGFRVTRYTVQFGGVLPGSLSYSATLGSVGFDVLVPRGVCHHRRSEQELRTPQTVAAIRSREAPRNRSDRH